jgi:hypothetical protein
VRFSSIRIVWRPFLVMGSLVMTISASSDTIDWGKAHPQQTFAGDVRVQTKVVRPLMGLSDEQLRERWNKPGGIGEASSAVRSAAGLWEATEDVKWRELGARFCIAALGELDSAPLGELTRRIDERGVKNAEHFLLRDACRLYALHYHLVRDSRSAARTGALLARFAEVIPTWSIYVPHYGDDKWSKACPQTAKGFYRDWDATGLWGTWIYQDLDAAQPLLDAYDLIHASGVLQDAGALESVEAVLRRHVRVQENYGRTLGNMDGTQIRGILRFARVLREPEWVHMCANWVAAIYRTQFYADGWWHEGTPSYHKQIHHNLQGTVRRYLQGYSDPPGFVSSEDGTRYDALDFKALVGGALERADAALRDIQQPNRICQVLNDTVFPQPVWWTPPMTQGRSILFGCMGHAILGTGSGKGNMVQASLSFGGTHGHEHFDCLSLTLFAKGHELISETRYRPQSISNTTREWHGMTAGHATVVVDEMDQTDRQSPAARGTPYRRERQPEDAIAGIPDWRWRWMGHGNALNDGKLRLFNRDFDMVQVVEADGERSYGGLVALDTYRRTLLLVKINETDTYVVDVFRVSGGTTHDYMLHSCLDVPHEVVVSLPLSPWEGRGAVLHKYITELQSADASRAWHATFPMEGGKGGLRTFVLGQEGAAVVVGKAPAMRREGTAPFLVVRKRGGESVFVAVHHPFSQASQVQSVEAVPLSRGQADGVALRIVLPGAVDTVLISQGEDGHLLTADGRSELKGHVAHARSSGTGGGWLYAVAAEQTRHDADTAAAPSYEGTICGTLRVEAGQDRNAFLTDAPVPFGRDLAGHTLIVDEGRILTQSFTISGVSEVGGRRAIEITGEPGMTITPGLVKLEYYPGWGIKGEARFRIAGTALKRR